MSSKEKNEIASGRATVNPGRGRCSSAATCCAAKAEYEPGEHREERRDREAEERPRARGAGEGEADPPREDRGAEDERDVAGARGEIEDVACDEEQRPGGPRREPPAQRHDDGVEVEEGEVCEEHRYRATRGARVGSGAESYQTGGRASPPPDRAQTSGAAPLSVGLISHRGGRASFDASPEMRPEDRAAPAASGCRSGPRRVGSQPPCVGTPQRVSPLQALLLSLRPLRPRLASSAFA